MRRPTSCSITVLSRCVLRCRMCRMWTTTREGEKVSIEQWNAFIRRVALVLDEPKELIISGGEPLLKEGVVDLIRTATENGLKTVMPTNGFLMTRDMARQLERAGLKEIFISLDSADPSIHDYLRGREGVFARVLAAVDLLSIHAPSVRINVLAVLSSFLVERIDAYLDLLKKDKRICGVYFQSIAAPFFVHTDNDWRGHPDFAELWPKDSKAACQAVDQIAAAKNSGLVTVHNNINQLELYKRYYSNPHQRVRQAGCYLGEYVINVDPAGDIRLCCFEESQGNILKDDIQKLWFSPACEQKRNEMRGCARNCHNMVNCFFREDEELM